MFGDLVDLGEALGAVVSLAEAARAKLLDELDRRGTCVNEFG